MKHSKVIFNTKALSKAIFDNLSVEQTNLFIEYAKERIAEIGNMIQTYNSRNHMDRTGNLLNSLCWGVYYKGEKKGSGFFRSPVIKSMGGNKGSTSYLHEFFANDAEPVNGRQLAEDFLSSYKPNGSGWTVFFAILAPYWGYWEGGFMMKSGGGESGIPRSTRFLQFQVMSHIYDTVRMDLKPAKTHLTVYVPKYSWKNPKYKNKRGYKRIGIPR